MSRLLDVSETTPLAWRDFEPVLAALSNPPQVGLILIDGTGDESVVSFLPDVAEWRDPLVTRAPQVVLAIGLNRVALDASLENSVALEVEVASGLQDFVMDTLNSRWPLVRTGLATAVAEPMIAEGRPVWGVRGTGVSPIGSLATFLEP